MEKTASRKKLSQGGASEFPERAQPKARLKNGREQRESKGTTSFAAVHNKSKPLPLRYSKSQSLAEPEIEEGASIAWKDNVTQF